VNASITKLYTFLLILFVALVALTSNWTVFDAEELEASSENKRPLFEEQQIARGEIRTVDGEVLAVSEPQGKGQSRIFVRDYPQGELFGNPVGYDFITQGRTGIEQSENDVLVGESNEFATIIEQIRGATQQGSNLTVTLDASAQRLATDLISQQGPGSLVAIEPSTGAVRAMVSSPGFDPNTVNDEGGIDALNNADPPRILNRATQELYPPGSTMKVVTAAAALDSGEFTPETTVDGNSGIDISGVPLENSGSEDFGTIPLTDALTFSVNTVWAQVAEELGPETMVEYMKRFGFYSDPPLDYPDGQMIPSGPYNTDGDLVEEGFDIGRVAIGQGGEEGSLLATPMQMAMVAATVANDGKLMEPTFLQEVTDPDGRVTEELDPDEFSEVMSEESAQQLTEMMTRVTQEGTATSLSLSGGATFAGKTGTAEKNIETRLNQPWFVMFAPAEDPQIAIAATVEECTACFGGQVAGPIATAVADELLGG
jgi:peptidoglycan glycosyltransferase